MKRALLPALLLVAVLGAFSAIAPAQTARHHRRPAAVMVPAGTQVILIFNHSLSSRTARAGQLVPLRVANSLVIGHRTIVRAGTPVRGIVQNVSQRRRFGVNATLQLALNPVRAIDGTLIPLEPRTVGRSVGPRTGAAGAASVGGAAILGPIGLAGGLFVHGRPVQIPAGSVLDARVSHSVHVR